MKSIIQNHVFFLLGSNLGDRVKMINNALEQISFRIGSIIKQSSVYESTPWGFEAEDNFLNKAVEVITILTPSDVLHEIHFIEDLQGRIRVPGQYSSRKIDIDILFYNNLTIAEKDLVIPHPLLQERRFALVPLAEIAGDLVHPLLKKRVSELLANCNDHSYVHQINDKK